MQIVHFILDKILKHLTLLHVTYYISADVREVVARQRRQSLQSNLISETVRFFGPPCNIT